MEGRKQGQDCAHSSVNPGYGPEQKRLNQNYSRCVDNITGNVLNAKTLSSSEQLRL